MARGSHATISSSEDARTVSRRIVLLGIAMLLALCGVLARFAWLQLGEHATYAARAENNRVRLRALPPNRGLILDRHGRVVADNRPAYRLVMTPERVPDREAAYAEIARIIGLSDDEREQVEQRVRRSRRFQTVTVKPLLSEREVARLALERHHLPGLDIEPYLVRHYPYGEALAHVVGYVARMDESDLRRLDPGNYRATTHTGRTGLERHYEARLHGTSGVERIETNAEGRMIRVLERSAPIPGEDLRISIDLDLQMTAIEALGAHPGAVVLMDITSGEVLALVSKPGFDPNLFVNGIAQSDYDALLRSPYRPLFNRFAYGRYEPGSTIKPYIALAGLEAGVITPATRIYSSGSYRLPGQERVYRDWREQGHGWVDLKAALAESVNIYFYDLANTLGIDAISRELALFGFGQATGIDLPGEGEGVLPSRRWKQRTLRQPWYPGETLITGIGQGFLNATPLQMAYAVAILAGQGRAASPRLVEGPEPATRVVHAERHWRAVHEGMHEVVHGARGTARAIASMLPVEIAGKTGTSQVFTRPEEDEVDPEQLPWFLRNHALFIAFAPYESPRFAIAVVAEHGGGGGSVAAPVAAAVLARALELEP
ncbi:MAG: penicillin-binding protein 2 [Wenzhouxiangellaceae bacterium]